MKIVQPKIRCLASPNFNSAEVCDFLTGEKLTWKRTEGATSAEELVEVAGRVCYMSFGKRQSPRDNMKYIGNLIAQGHESVLEHVSWTFLASGVSRAFTHQLVRHRVGFAYSQLSQQYYDESEANIVAPMNLRGSPEYAVWLDSIRQAMSAYRKMLSSVASQLKNGKEQNREVRSTARSLLPNAVEATIVFSANARALRHFLSVRGGIEGDWEMRAVSCELLKVLSKDAPALFNDFYIEEMSDGTGIVKKRSGVSL